MDGALTVQPLSVSSWISISNQIEKYKFILDPKTNCSTYRSATVCSLASNFMNLLVICMSHEVTMFLVNLLDYLESYRLHLHSFYIVIRPWGFTLLIYCFSIVRCFLYFGKGIVYTQIFIFSRTENKNHSRIRNLYW